MTLFHRLLNIKSSRKSTLLLRFNMTSSQLFFLIALLLTDYVPIVTKTFLGNFFIEETSKDNAVTQPTSLLSRLMRCGRDHSCHFVVYFNGKWQFKSHIGSYRAFGDVRIWRKHVGMCLLCFLSFRLGNKKGTKEQAIIFTDPGFSLKPFIS